jgi:hypothetical protein
VSECRVVPDPGIPRFSVGYNSRGDWSTLDEIRELELDRGNGFPDLPGCPGDTPAIWVTRTPREALRYAENASEWDRIDAGGPLTDEERDTMDGIAANPIAIRPTDLLAVDDGDGGYLVLRPEEEPPEGNIGRRAVTPGPMSGCITTGRRAGYCPPPGSAATRAEGDEAHMRALIDEYLFFATALDGIVVDPDRANDPNIPCRGVEITRSDGSKELIAFHRGIIGTLTQEQVRQFCRTTIPLRHPEGIERRVAAFQRASEECGGIPIEERLGCMSAALHRRGERWGEANAR